MAAGRVMLVLTALPDAKSARRVAELLIRTKSAACVTAIPGVLSTYRWKGRISRSRETLLVVKAPRKNYLKIERAIRKNHPYELPEILRIPLDGGSSEYLSWLHRSC